MSASIGDIFNWETVVPLDLNKTVTATGTPEALADSEILFQSLTITGNKAAQDPNSSTAYLGSSISQDIPIAPGENIIVNAPEGKRMDLQNWYLRVGTNGDGVRGQYVI